MGKGGEKVCFVRHESVKKEHKQLRGHLQKCIFRIKSAVVRLLDNRGFSCFNVN